VRRVFSQPVKPCPSARAREKSVLVRRARECILCAFIRADGSNMDRRYFLKGAASGLVGTASAIAGAHAKDQLDLSPKGVEQAGEPKIGQSAAMPVFASPVPARRVARLARPPDLMVSVWYNGGKARAPMLSPITPNSREEWRGDLRQIRSLGFNTVRGWVDWSHNEPQEGKYNFDNLRLLFELAREAGLRVVIQIYAGWDGFGFAPDWAHKKFSDAFVHMPINEVSAPPPSSFYSDHKGVQAAILRFMTETARVAVSYPNFYGWDLWSEPRGMRLVGPETRQRYQQWLKNKYKTIDALNLEWYETYASFDDVAAQRTGGIGTYAMDLDWRDFIAQKGAEDMATQYVAVRQVDKTHWITSHASPPSVFGSELDDFLQAGSLDYYGLSVYPRYVGEPRLWRLLMGADFARCANRQNGGFYVGEFQAGFSTNGMSVGDPVTPEDQRTWVWSLIAKGARGVNIYAYYVMSSGVESGGFGLVGLDGKPTKRAIALGQAARSIERNKGLLVKSTPVGAQVAIIYNPAAQAVGGARGTPATTPTVRGRAQPGAYYQVALSGYYRAFAENNVPVDFIHRTEVESGDLSRYKLVIIPCPVILAPKAAAGLKRYVERGGSLVSEARLAWNSEHAYTADVIPGMGLSEVFGIRETKVLTRNDVRIEIVDNSNPALARLNRGDSLKGAQFAESLELLSSRDAKVLGRLADGTPGMTVSTYGKGQTMFIGSFLGLANQPSNKNNNQFLLGLLNWAKVSRPFSTSQDGVDTATPLEARLHKNTDGYLLYLINHGEAGRTLSVNLNVEREGEFALSEILSKQTARKRSNGKVLTFSSQIPAKQVQVWDIRV
jgi:beta-galactosidase